MKAVALLFFLGYVAALLLAGIVGIFAAEWELTTLYRVDLAALGEKEKATVLNQFRYLKSIELGVAAFCVAFRKEILSDSRMHRLFLAIVFIGVGARLFSVIIDGVPHWAYLGFMAFEFGAGVAVRLLVKETSARS